MATDFWPRISIVLAVIGMISCQSGDVVRQEKMPSGPPPSVVVTPDVMGDVHVLEDLHEKADSSNEAASAGQHDEPFRLPSGDYWIRRLNRLGIMAVSASSPKSGPPWETKRTGSTVCQRLSLSEDNTSNRHKARLILSENTSMVAYVGQQSWKFAFYAFQSDDGWMFRGPRLDRDYFQASAQCNGELIVEPMQNVEGVLESNAGPIFSERQSCEEASDHFVQRCVEGDCNYDDPTSQPFRLTGCEGAMAKVRAMGSRVLGTEHSDAMRTLIEFEKRVQKGAKLWQRLDGDEACGQVVLVPDEDGRVRVESRHPTDDGGYTDTYGVYAFEPLFHRATRFSRGSVTYRRDGEVSGMGASGLSVNPEIPLYLTADAVLLGERFLYLERSVCEAKP